VGALTGISRPFHGYRAVAQLKRNPEVAVDDHRVGSFLWLKSPGFDLAPRKWTRRNVSPAV